MGFQIFLTGVMFTVFSVLILKGPQDKQFEGIHRAAAIIMLVSITVMLVGALMDIWMIGT